MYIPAPLNIHGICMVYTIHIPYKIFIGVPDAYIRNFKAPTGMY